jgi:hypothetical protein
MVYDYPYYPPSYVPPQPAGRWVWVSDLPWRPQWPYGTGPIWAVTPPYHQAVLGDNTCPSTI